MTALPLEWPMQRPRCRITTLVALSDREVWPGWRDGDIWRHLDAVPITDARVTH